MMPTDVDSGFQPRKLLVRAALVFLVLAAAILIALLAPHKVSAQTPTPAPLTLPTATPRASGSLSPGATTDHALPAAVEGAIVRIVSTGDYRRIFDSANARSFGTGSGFVIDGSGHIVTNAHVANGGSKFDIFFDGGVDSVAATLYDIDECADIALLTLDDPAAAPTFLQWRSTPAAIGETIYAAGYPGGVAELRATQGAIRNTDLRAFTDWASVQHVIDHTAFVEPGNSGGPLLDSAGSVVGVVYARGGTAGDAAAIAGENAQEIVRQLLDGDSGFRTGINGQAFSVTPDQYGIWVVSVAPGSAADSAGILPGDIVRRFDNRVVARDGTLARYCQLLRDLAPDAAPNIEVLRPDTGEVLSGALNGVALRPFRSLAAAAFPTPTPVPTPVAAPLVLAENASGDVALNVPGDWSYRLTDSVGFGSLVTARIFGVAPTSDAYATGQALLRVVVGETIGLSAEEILDQTRGSLYCAAFERSDYEDASWFGIVDRCTGVHDPTYVNAFLNSQVQPDLFANLNFFVSTSAYPIELDAVIAPLAQTLLPSLPVADRPSAVVQVQALNVREGPGLGYTPITQVYSGESLPIAGKDSEACEWVFVAYSNLAGWVAAAPQYITLDRACAELEVLTADEIAEWITERQ